MKLLRGKACQSALQRGNGKRLTVMGEVLMDGFSDRGSIPLISIEKRVLNYQGSFLCHFQKESFYILMLVILIL